MLEGITWLYPLLLTVVVVIAVFLSTRSSDWYERSRKAIQSGFLDIGGAFNNLAPSRKWYLKLFTLVFYREMAFGKLLPIFPPDSKPPSRESLAMYGIFSKFPKTNIPKPVLERRAAFDRTGVLQTKSATTKIEKPFIVPFLPSSPASLSTPGVVVYPIRPAVSLHGKVIVYLHAGTYISGSIRSHGKFVSHIAEQAHRLLYFVEYSLGPEAPVPQGISDVISVYDWLLKVEKYREEDISVVGDSAGGGMTFLTMQELKRRGYKLPGSIWVMSPWTDLSCSGSSWKTHLQSDVMLNPYDFRPGSVTLEHATGLKHSTVDQLQSPFISPLFAPDYSHFPKTLIQVGGAECLLSDSVEMHRKLVTNRSHSTLQIYDHQQHIFQLYYDWIPESRQAVAAGCKWLTQDDAENKKK